MRTLLSALIGIKDAHLPRLSKWADSLGGRSCGFCSSTQLSFRRGGDCGQLAAGLGGLSVGRAEGRGVPGHPVHRRDAGGLILLIADNPACRGFVAEQPSCHYFAASFEGLYRAILGPRARVVETGCEAASADACRFRVT
ncbi:MAG: V4R domain-containing protein [Sandaracinobacter sp.]